MVTVLVSQTHEISIPSREPKSGGLQYNLPFTFSGNLEMIITDVSTNEVTTLTPLNFTFKEGILKVNFDFQTIESRFYRVVINSFGELTKFRMFATDQTDLQNYDIQQGEFKYAAELDLTNKY